MQHTLIEAQPYFWLSKVDLELFFKEAQALNLEITQHREGVWELRPGFSSAVAVAALSGQHAHTPEKQEISFLISLL